VSVALPMFARPRLGVALTPRVEALVADGAPVAIGVSGGKDSSAVAFATVEYLDAVNHRGPRVLIHSDLGLVEWADSLPACERLAARLGLELIVVRRAAGGLMERWETRWANNVARYAELRCVKLILPWSTPSMRFCTSELKTAVICRALTKRFPGQTILSVSGVRRDESTARSKAPIDKEQPQLRRRGLDTRGYDWNAIADWSLADVLGKLRAVEFPLHEAYTVYGSSRVSCAFCILGSRADLIASSKCEANADVYRRMVRLEAASTFGFQDKKWLADVAPHLLDDATREAVETAKDAAQVREKAEAMIPPHLLYTKGWPHAKPTRAEAKLLCYVRRVVASSVGITVRFTDPDELIGRYEELMRTG
jgi:3'-phosphoadenosine 5'-phosphosulfate sulfotransferase (PAPS reductase)/FAD synthetase